MIIFKNDGVIDIANAMTFGISHKEGDNPFGQFGTGLKYAVAICLRLGCSIKCVAGGVEYKFSTRDVNFRDEKYSKVYMNDEPLGFTTHLGSHWEPWQAYRELLCNAMDEEGFELFEKPLSNYLDECTYFIVEGRPMVEVHETRYKYFLHDQKPAHEITDVVHAYRSSEPGFYLRGVLIHKPTECMKYSYDILNTRTISLNEDRSVKYEFSLRSKLVDAMASCSDANLIIELLSRSTDDVSNEWESNTVIDPTHFCHSHVVDAIRDQVKNPRNKLYPNFLNNLISIGWEASMVPYTPTLLEQKMIKKAQDFLDELGYNSSEFPIQYVEDLGNRVMGKADYRNLRITISRRVFNEGCRYFASTLLEELVHLRTGLTDETRAFETHLFDMILKLGEEFVGEPL